MKIFDRNALLSDLEDVDEMCNTFTETFLRVARECIPTKMVTIRNSDRPWFNSELRREIRKRDRIRKIASKFNKQSDIDKYKKQRNKKKTAKEHFEQYLDTLILENISNPKTYWKIMKMLIKSNKGYSNIPPLQNIIQDEGLEEIATKTTRSVNYYITILVLFLLWKMPIFLFQILNIGPIIFCET